jgi:hypothetical protein
LAAEDARSPSGLTARLDEAEQASPGSLRYLLACLEETGRVEGLRLMIEDVQQRKGSLAELVARLRAWRQAQATPEKSGEAPQVFADAF